MAEQESTVRRRPGGRSARVRAAVNQAVLDLLAERPYESISIEDVATRAGVHKTTVYRRWPTKVALVTDAALARSETEVPVPDTGSFASDLEQFCLSVARNLRSPVGGTTARNLIAAAAGSEELTRGTHEFWSERLGLATTIVRRAVDRGELDDSVDAGLLVETLVGPLYVRLLLSGEPLDDEFACTVAALVARGALSAS